MRAVERTPWAEKRSSRHDEMCAIIAKDPYALLHYTRAEVRPDRVLVEAPCGSGFCDIIIELYGRTVAVFVEVKTDAERCSGGDVIRQLRWYAANRGGYQRKHLVCVPESQQGPVFDSLLQSARVRQISFEEIWDISRCNPAAYDNPISVDAAPPQEAF